MGGEKGQERGKKKNSERVVKKVQILAYAHAPN